VQVLRTLRHYLAMAREAPDISMRAAVCLLLLCTAVPCLFADTNVTQHPIINISFVKEVTLSIQPQDLAELAVEVSPEESKQAESFLASSLRFLDPIMHFFENLVFPPPVPPSPV
jgi:hypothetical protein